MVTTQNQGTVVPGPQMQQQQSQYPTSQDQQQHPVNQVQPRPPVTSSLPQPPLQSQVAFYDQIAPPGTHPQARYELPQQPKY